MNTAIEYDFDHGTAIGYLSQNCRCTECVGWYCGNKRKVTALRHRRGRPWTPSEDATVLRGDITAGEIGRLIQRSIDEIYPRRQWLRKQETVADRAEELDIRWDLSEATTTAPPLTEEQLDRVRKLLAAAE